MRITGITIPDEKNLEIGLTVLYGIGRSTAEEIMKDLEIPMHTKAKDLNETQENSLRQKIEEHTIEGDLKREKSSNIKRLKDIGTYRGMRHSHRLPTRGQRTKTNARTLKGTKRTMGTGRRKVDKK
jgi:small subunit ribosomal protein S13